MVLIGLDSKVVKPFKEQMLFMLSMAGIKKTPVNQC